MFWIVEEFTNTTTSSTCKHILKQINMSVCLCQLELSQLVPLPQINSSFVFLLHPDTAYLEETFLGFHKSWQVLPKKKKRRKERGSNHMADGPSSTTFLFGTCVCQRPISHKGSLFSLPFPDSPFTIRRTKKSQFAMSRLARAVPQFHNGEP